MDFHGQQTPRELFMLIKAEIEELMKGQAQAVTADQEISENDKIEDLKEKLYFTRFENRHLRKKLKRSRLRVEKLETILDTFQLELYALQEDKVDVECEQECRISELTTKVKSLEKELKTEASQRKFGVGNGGLDDGSLSRVLGLKQRCEGGREEYETPLQASPPSETSSLVVAQSEVRRRPHAPRHRHRRAKSIGDIDSLRPTQTSV